MANERSHAESMQYLSSATPRGRGFAAVVPWILMLLFGTAALMLALGGTGEEPSQTADTTEADPGRYLGWDAPIAPVWLTDASTGRGSIEQRTRLYFSTSDGNPSAPGVAIPTGAWPMAVAAPAGAVLEEIRVVPGQNVEAGQVLAVLSMPGLEARIAEAEAKVDELAAAWALMQSGVRDHDVQEAALQVDRARAVREEVEARLEAAQAVGTRAVAAGEQRRLVREAAEAARAMELAELAAERLEARIPSEESIAEARHAAAVANLSALTNLRDSLTLKASRPARVMRVAGPIGRVIPDVQTAATAADTAVVVLFDPASVQVRVALAARDRARVREGTPCRISLVGRSGEFAGTVRRLSPVIDTGTRTVDVMVAFDDPEMRALPGVLAQVEFRLQGESR